MPLFELVHPPRNHMATCLALKFIHLVHSILQIPNTNSRSRGWFSWAWPGPGTRPERRAVQGGCMVDSPCSTTWFMTSGVTAGSVVAGHGARFWQVRFWKRHVTIYSARPGGRLSIRECRGTTWLTGVQQWTLRQVIHFHQPRILSSIKVTTGFWGC